MKIVELILGDDEFAGVDAISIVESPAIEEDFIALKSQKLMPIKFKQADKKKKVLVGPLLIPNKPIFRKEGKEEYYIYFSRDTVRKASQLFLKKGHQSKSTLEHLEKIQGLTLVESWIVEDKENDKSNMYDMDVPLGTWMGAVKVDNNDIWNEYVETGLVKGFSIEGYFADKAERPKEPIAEELSEQDAQYILDQMHEMILTFQETGYVELESFSDYPAGVKNNAKKGLELNEKIDNKCATQVGKVRATQLAAGKPISTETIKRMYSYLSRAEEDYRDFENDSEACANISYLLWGGLAALGWSRNKLKELGELELDDNPCQPGYEMIGMKMKNGKKVPNCVPIKRK